ncbi:hypothetical protein BH18ACT14_BH18ACT14_18780 [soil metagenome]
MPTVSRLSTTPVKGSALHHPDEIRLERDGVPGNREFFLVDPKGRLYGCTRHGPLVQVRSEYEADPERLALHFPEGRVVEDAVALGEERVRADFWGRPVDAQLVLGPFGEAYSDYIGKPVRLVRTSDRGGAFDVHVVTLLSEASVAELGRQAGVNGDVDGRRFRMLLTLEGCEPHEEDTWEGRRFRVGSAVIRIGGKVPRCVVTTRDPDTGVRDFDSLREIKAYRGLRDGKEIDFGVYAEVEEPGVVHVGDTLEDA